MAEYAALVRDWRAEQSILDARAALAPFVTARVNGDKRSRLEDFMVTGKPRSAESSGVELAAKFRSIAFWMNAERRAEKAHGKA